MSKRKLITIKDCTNNDPNKRTKLLCDDEVLDENVLYSPIQALAYAKSQKKRWLPPVFTDDFKRWMIRYDYYDDDDDYNPTVQTAELTGPHLNFEWTRYETYCRKSLEFRCVDTSVANLCVMAWKIMATYFLDEYTTVEECLKYQSYLVCHRCLVQFVHNFEVVDDVIEPWEGLEGCYYDDSEFDDCDITTQDCIEYDNRSYALERQERKALKLLSLEYDKMIEDLPVESKMFLFGATTDVTV